MNITLLKGKIHRATVKQAALDYVGSITIDEALMEASGIVEYEKVHIADVDNGSRFETYVIAGERGTGMICLNGAAARCVSVGDKVIIMSYAQMTAEEFKVKFHTSPVLRTKIKGLQRNITAVRNNLEKDTGNNGERKIV